MGATLPSFILFGLLVAAAIGFRRQPETHKRLMLLATIKLMSAGLDRLFGRVKWARASGPDLGWRGGRFAAATACGGRYTCRIGTGGIFFRNAHASRIILHVTSDQPISALAWRIQ